MAIRCIQQIYVRRESEVRGSMLLINPKPKGRGVYQWQTSDDQGQGSYVCCIHRNVHMIHYDEVILVLLTV